MLTAVSVARECGMIPTQSRAVVIKASFGSTAEKPRLSYRAVGETSDQMHLLSSNSMSGTFYMYTRLYHCAAKLYVPNNLGRGVLSTFYHVIICCTYVHV